ncbi:MAG: hypothetical protein H6637_04130 [Ardenticatenales bacterium]|nr:hypothetical protein [Ardenticatenales bacterium]
MAIAVHPQPDDHGGSSLHGGHGLWVPVGSGRRARPRAAAPTPRPTAWAAALEPIRRARPRVTIAVHARQRTTTAGRPYTVAMVCGWPVGSGRRARPRAAAPTPRPTA